MKLEALNFRDLIEDFYFETQAKRLAILGPSGCGKTSLLRLLAGLEPYEGRIEIGDFSMAFQEPRLIPWLTLEENLRLISSQDWEEYLKLLGLYEDRHKYPRELSGGMAQRASLARALAFPSELLILDEPFSGIDLGRKEEIKELISSRNFILVTHSPGDALDLAEEILLVDGPPLRIIKHYENTEAIEEELTGLLQALTRDKNNL